MASMRTFTSYVRVVLGAIVMIAALVLLLLQWGNQANLSLYGKNIQNANTGWLMLFSAVGGVLLAAVIHQFVAGLRVLLTQRDQRRRLEAQIQRAQASQQVSPPPPAGPSPA